MIASPSSPTAVVITYVVAATSADFASTGAAYTAFSNALTLSISTGIFSSNLESQAAANTAIYLAGSSIVPQQPSLIQSFPFTSAPTMSPTAVPSYAAGKPSPTPTRSPTASPTSRPTVSPSYGAGQPTPQPTASPGPTAAPAKLFVTQVCIYLLKPCMSSSSSLIACA